MPVNHKQLSEGVELISDSVVASVIRQREANRLHDFYMAIAAGAAGYEAGQPSSRRWFVLCTANRSEIAVHNLLEHYGVEVYLPMKLGDPNRRGCWPIAARGAKSFPAFPGYLFARVQPCNETWQGILRLDGVIGVIGTAEHPVSISDKEINKLIRFVAAGGLDKTVKAKGLLKGDRVLIKDGPFADFEATVMGYSGSKHVRVLTALFGTQVTTKLSLAQIVKLD